MEGRTGELQGLTLSSEQTRNQYFLHVPSLRSIKMSRAERTTEEGWGESRTLNYDAIASVSKKWILMESWTSWTGPDHLCEATVNITCWKAKELITAGTSWLCFFLSSWWQSFTQRSAPVVAFVYLSPKTLLKNQPSWVSFSLGVLVCFRRWSCSRATSIFCVLNQHQQGATAPG